MIRGGFLMTCLLAAGCSKPTEPPVTLDAGAVDSGVVLDAGEADAGLFDAGSGDDAGMFIDAGVDAGSVDALTANRNRLFDSYGAYLDAGTCATWNALTPSAQAVFFTLTTRMQNGRLRADGGSMLSHITKVYRVVGGENASASNAGSCGGGEYNRMMLSMDETLHTALRDANSHQGAMQSGEYDVSDDAVASFWRNSHDLGGAHSPFDESDETDQGAPRGQVQYFADPASTTANAPLGRLQLETLVDPYALEFDQDYDCIHSSNPLCDYISYGPLCSLGASTSGVELFIMKYGDTHSEWRPAGCP